MGSASTNRLGVEWFGLVMGLGFVLSFGYWCTDFLVVERAMAADSMGSARRTPLIAAVPKMIFPFLVIVPGMIALVIGGKGIIPPKMGAGGIPLTDTAGRVILDYDLATPSMLMHLFPNGMLGIGLAALLASFMSGIAGNLTAVKNRLTYEFYPKDIRQEPDAPHLPL